MHTVVVGFEETVYYANLGSRDTQTIAFGPRCWGKTSGFSENRAVPEVCVVPPTLCRIRQNAVCIVDNPEQGSRLGTVVPIRMVLKRRFSKRGFYCTGSCRCRHTKNVVQAVMSRQITDSFISPTTRIPVSPRQVTMPLYVTNQKTDALLKAELEMA